MSNGMWKPSLDGHTIVVIYYSICVVVAIAFFFLYIWPWFKKTKPKSSSSDSGTWSATQVEPPSHFHTADFFDEPRGPVAQELELVSLESRGSVPMVLVSQGSTREMGSKSSSDGNPSSADEQEVQQLQAGSIEAVADEFSTGFSGIEGRSSQQISNS